jgi:hypothetical protein
MRGSFTERVVVLGPVAVVITITGVWLVRGTPVPPWPRI